ncbi:F0F1 ATP synthase subunit A [Coprothermobacteraceae bacterium]|nr:F0F1 ATP synthase subunit A [Coprothermobacteraceae bacterium]
MSHELTLSVNSLYWSFAVTALLWVLVLYANRRMKSGGLWLYGIMALWNWLIGYGRQVLGHYSEEVMPFLSTFFVYILASNWLGLLPGFVSPTRDLSVTLGLAVVLLVWVHSYAIRKMGVKGYLKVFFAPAWWMFPLNLMEHITRLLSLSLRLYGNVSGEHLAVAVISLLAPLFAPIPLLGLSMFTGFIQAYIFMTLGMAYTAGFLEEGGLLHE